MNINLYTTFRQ